MTGTLQGEYSITREKRSFVRVELINGGFRAAGASTR